MFHVCNEEAATIIKHLAPSPPLSPSVQTLLTLFSVPLSDDRISPSGMTSERQRVIDKREETCMHGRDRLERTKATRLSGEQGGLFECEISLLG